MTKLNEAILYKFGVSMCRKIIVISNFPKGTFLEFLEDIKNRPLYHSRIKCHCCRIIFEFGDIVFLAPDENKFRGYRADLIIFAPNTICT